MQSNLPGLLKVKGLRLSHNEGKGTLYMSLSYVKDMSNEWRDDLYICINLNKSIFGGLALPHSHLGQQNISHKMFSNYLVDCKKTGRFGLPCAHAQLVLVL